MFLCVFCQRVGKTWVSRRRKRELVSHVKLTEKQKRFADIYIQTSNATQSYIDAGYKATSRVVAEANARKLLAHYSVKNYIDELISQKDSERIAKQDEVLSYLTSIMRGEQTEQTLIGEGKGAQSITDIEVSAKDRIKAAELLGKRYGLWVDKQDIDIKGAVTFIDDIGDEDET